MISSKPGKSAVWFQVKNILGLVISVPTLASLPVHAQHRNEKVAPELQRQRPVPYETR
jgi:hypothetical protein